MVGDRVVFFISIPEQCSCVHGSNFRNMLSIKVPFLFENRVGNVICGHRLCTINRSNKSLMKLTHRPRIASTMIKLVSEPNFNALFLLI